MFGRGAGYDYRNQEFRGRNPVTDIERIFLWQGQRAHSDPIVKHIEISATCCMNANHWRARAAGVEDNIRYYSSFLPVIYTELIKQSRRVIQEGIKWRTNWCACRRGRKILLSSNFEDAAALVQQYRNYLFGVVSDVEFPWDGKLNPRRASNWRAW